MTKMTSAGGARGKAAIWAMLATVPVALLLVPSLVATSWATDFSNPAPIIVPSPPAPASGCPGTPATSLTTCPPDRATLYPSPIAVAGLTGTVTKIAVTLKGLSWTLDGPADADIMVVGPGGQAVLIMSDACGVTPIPTSPGLTLTFDDAAAAPLPTAACTSGTYKPTNIQDASECIPFRTPDAFPTPAPVAQPTSSSLGDFNGTNPNGTWSLYVVDDCPNDPSAQAGAIAGGWTLSVATTTDPSTTTTTGGGSTTTTTRPGSSTTTTTRPGSTTTTTRPGTCTPVTGTQDAGLAMIGQTLPIDLTPACRFATGGAVNVTVNGQAVPTKIANANGSVRVTITVVSPTTLSVDDPVIVPAICGLNTVSASGPAAVGSVPVTQSATFTVLCPSAPPPAFFAPQSFFQPPFVAATAPFPAFAAAEPQQQQQQQSAVVSGSRSAPGAGAVAPAGAASAAGGRVAFTGSNVARSALVGLVLMALGASCLVPARRRLPSSYR